MDKPNIKITYEIPDGATDQEKLSLAQMASIKLMLEEADYVLAQIATLKSDEPGIESGIQAAKGILEELPERMHLGLDDAEVGSAMREVRQLLDRSKYQLHIKLAQPYIDHSKSMSAGNPKSSETDLKRIINAALDHLEPKASWKEILNYIDKNKGEVIQRVHDDREIIEWKRSSGKLAKTSFKRLRNIISELRKPIPKN